MSVSMLDFVRLGKLGKLEIGLSRNDVVKRMGLPKNWIGKPPTFYRPIILFPDESNHWYYYDCAAQIVFDEFGVSIAIRVDPSAVGDCKFPFWDWPFESDVIMSEIIEWLEKESVSFVEMDLDWMYCILIENRCLVTCFPFEKGRLIEGRYRKVSLMWTVVDLKYLSEFIKDEVLE